MATITATSTSDEMTDIDPPTGAEATTTIGGPVWPVSSKLPAPSQSFAVVDAGATDAEPARQPAHQSLWATTLLITTLCGVTFASSMTAGLLAVAIPTMAQELNISDGLLLW